MRNLFLAAVLIAGCPAASFAAELAGVKVEVKYEDFKHVRVKVSAWPTFAGKVVRTEDSEGNKASATLADKVKLAVASFTLNEIPAGKTALPVKVFVDDKLVLTQTLSDLNQLRRDAFNESEFYFDQYIFSGRDFPKGHFGKVGVIENLHVPFTFKTEFINAAFQAATTADAPGRYGAVTTITTQDGKILKRRATLFRLPDGVTVNTEDVLALNASKFSFINPDVLKAHANSVDPLFVKWMKQGFGDSDGAAQILAGLYENKSDIRAQGSFGPLISRT